MPIKVAGRIVLPTPRPIVLEGLTTVTLNIEDVILEIRQQIGTGIPVRLLQMYPFVTEGRMIWIWNNSGLTANIGRANTDPGYQNTAYDMPLQTMPHGRVYAFRFYVHGGLPNAAWATWHQV